MRVVKPAWVQHSAEKGQRTPIYSLSVHPDGTRLATAGMDRKIKIWSTIPITDSTKETEDNPKLLCTMSEHTGSVLCVRWDHQGRFLASGSDDSVAMIWGLDPDGGGRLWGSDEVNVENWKPLTRLVAHQADIIDIAWSRDDSMLASVGLDGMVWIWSGATFERLGGFRAHDGFVKGVTWDPVGQYLATQSDDKTVKIWDTETWKLVKTVSEPFADSGHATFYRRLSWSPDGAFIAASNAKNGPVFVASIIDREDFSSPFSFVGHANAIQVAAFNPRLFFTPDDPHSRATASSIVALGANDFSISIWRNTMHTPLVVLHDVFGREPLDLCWSDDGLHLYGCSHDGTICAVSFDPAELPDMGESHETEMVLKEWGWKPPANKPRLTAPRVGNGFGATSSSTSVNVIQPRKKPGDNRRVIKRIDPSKQVRLLPNGHSSASSTGLQPPSRDPIPALAPPAPLMTESASAFADAEMQPLEVDGQASRDHMFQNAGQAFDSPRVAAKRKASTQEERAPKGRTMGRSQPLTDVREIRPVRAVPVASGSGSGSGLGGGARRMLPPPTIQTVLRATSGDADKVYLEASNAEDERGRNKVTYSLNGEDMWMDFVPSAVLALVLTASYTAVGCEDGSVSVYSPAGRHLFSTRCTAPIAEMAGSKGMLAVLTTDCNLQVFDVRAGKALFAPVSVAHLLDADPNAVYAADITLEALAVRANGAPILLTSQPAAWVYDRARLSFVPLVTPFQLASSPLFTSSGTSRSRHSLPAANASGISGAASSNTPVADVEAAAVELYRRAQLGVGGAGGVGETQKDPVKWFDVAMVLQHAEMRLRAAEVLGSKEEYKGFMKDYAKKVGQEGFKGRAEELVKELYGPIYFVPGKKVEWESEVVGWSKRDLAKTVVAQFSTYPGLQAWAADWHQVFKRAADDDRCWKEM